LSNYLSPKKGGQPAGFDLDNSTARLCGYAGRWINYLL